MSDTIVIEMNAGEALIALGAIQDKAQEASRLAAISNGEEHEIAVTTMRILGRIAYQLSDALYPRCDWLEECDMAVAEGSRYCRFHTEQIVASKARLVVA